MSTKEVYDYVMNTPKNTNPAVLSSMLGHLSWNDLKDKPFYAETRPKTLVDNGTVTVAKSAMAAGNVNFSISDESQKLVVGKTYIVTWGGVEYTCVARPAFSHAYVGNIDMTAGYYMDTGASDGTQDKTAPFCILSDANRLGYDISAEKAGDYTFSIVSATETVETVHKLDAKYLPDNVGGGYILKPVVTEIYGGTSYSEVITDGTDMVKAIENGANVMILFPAGTIAPTAHLVTAMSWSIRDGALFCETTLGAIAFSNAPIPSYLR